MKKFFSGLTGEYRSTAKVVDGSLILSLPDALSPIVWRMELGAVKSSALEVRDPKDGTHVLALKTPRNDVHDIAPFATRGQAVRALMAVARALETSHGQVMPAPAAATAEAPSYYAPPARPARRFGRWLAALAVLLLLLLAFSALLHQTPRTNTFSAVPGGDTTAATPDAPGVPLSADEYLQQQKTTAQP